MNMLSVALTPLERYQRDLKREGFKHDAAQQQAVTHLQDLYEQLLTLGTERWDSNLWGAVAGFFSGVLHRKSWRAPVRGLYLWGGVGRGKTYLMDNFYESLPFQRKLRAHFHRFMRRVHQELKTLNGEKNPLDTVADRLSQEARVICFDEFFVSDITDAMTLANLLDGLFRRGVSLVATSNIVPDDLYRNGLQRERFLPAIELLKKYTHILNVDGGVDHRLRALEQVQLYYSPLGGAADASLLESFQSLVPDREEIRENVTLDVENRSIRARYEAEDVVWFDFSELCDGPRSQNDYIELAREYHAVLVSGVPQMSLHCEDQARRFINMVDEFYDRNVKLVISAAAPLDRIYIGSKLRFEFERTGSRLLEMQSHEYLERPHKP